MIKKPASLEIGPFNQKERMQNEKTIDPGSIG